jgi:hypothetical protein
MVKTLNEKNIINCNKLGKIASMYNNIEYGCPYYKNRDLIRNEYTKYLKKYAKLLESKNEYYNKNDRNLVMIDAFKTLLYINDKCNYKKLYGDLKLNPIVCLIFPNIDKYNFKISIRDLNLLKKSMGIYYENNGKKLLVNKEVLNDIVLELWCILMDIKKDKEKYNFIPQKKDVLDELNKKIHKVDSVNYTFSKYFKSKIKYTCSNSIMRDFKRFSEICEDDW